MAQKQFQDNDCTRHLPILLTIAGPVPESILVAAGRVACTGSSGEDYAIPGRNALVLETTDPQEFLGLFGELRAHPDQERAIRRAERVTARQYRWSEIVQRVLVPRVSCLAAAGPDPSRSKAA